MAAPRCQRRLYTDLDLSDRDRKRFRYLAGRLGQRRGREPLNRMPHKDVYLIDISLAIGYAFDEVSGWRDWVHGHLLRGRLCASERRCPRVSDSTRGRQEVLPAARGC